MQYFVVMIDYGRRGREAIVDPEMTYANMIDRVASGEYKNILFVHHIKDGIVSDITDEVMEAADTADRPFDFPLDNVADHARKLRAEAV